MFVYILYQTGLQKSIAQDGKSQKKFQWTDGVEYFPKAGELYRIPDSGRQAYWSGSEEPWIKHCFNVNGPLVPELLKPYSLENVRLIHNSPVRNVSPTDCSRRRKIGRNARFSGFSAISFPGNGVIFPYRISRMQ